MDRAENSINSIIAMMQCDIFTTSHVKSKSRGVQESRRNSLLDVAVPLLNDEQFKVDVASTNKTILDKNRPKNIVHVIMMSA